MRAWPAPAQGLIATGVTTPLLLGVGTAAAPALALGYVGTGIYSAIANTSIDLAIAGAQVVQIGAASIALLHNSGAIYLGASSDTALTRDAANVLALKNGTTAQTFRVYGTTTGAKYLSLSHNGTDGLVDTAATSGQLTLGGTNATGVRVGASGKNLGFYATTPIALQTGVAVTAGGIHAALVALGLITA